MGFGGFLKALVKPAISIGASLIPGGSLIKDGIKAGIDAAGGAAGAALSGNANAAAANRGSMIDALLQQQQLRQEQQNGYDTAVTSRANTVENGKQRFFDEMLAREKEGRDSGNNAFKGMQQAAYVQGGGSEFHPRDGQHSLGIGPHAATADEMAGAGAFKAELMNRLQNGNQMMMPESPEAIAAIERPADYTIDPKLLQPGGMEKYGGMVGTGLTMFDAMRRGQQPPPIMTGGPTSGRPAYAGGVAPGQQRQTLYRPELA